MDGAAEQQGVQAQVARQAAGDEPAQRDRQRLHEDEQHHRPADDAAIGIVHRAFEREPETEAVHQHGAADQQHQVEQDRQQEDADRLPQGEMAVGTRQHGAGGEAIEKNGGAASRAGQPEHVAPVIRRLPDAEGVVARDRDERDHDDVHDDVGGLGVAAGEGHA